jgi:hypothetical protein
LADWIDVDDFARTSVGKKQCRDFGAQKIEFVGRGTVDIQTLTDRVGDVIGGKAGRSIGLAQGCDLGCPLTNCLIIASWANFATETNDLAHDECSGEGTTIVDDDAVDVIAGHPDDEIGLADVVARHSPAHVFREVKSAGRKSFHRVIGSGAAPAECSDRMNARIHSAFSEMVREQAHRHWRATGVSGADDKNLDAMILEGGCRGRFAERASPARPLISRRGDVINRTVVDGNVIGWLGEEDARSLTRAVGTHRDRENAVASRAETGKWLAGRMGDH